MAEFDRRLWKIGLDSLQRLTSETVENWWKDLLRCWRVSGAPSGEHGLRLAIRNGYLNFYRKGQSVARISQARDGRPVVDVHLKFVDKDATQQGYARLAGNEILRGPDRQPLAYCGRDTLLQWIAAAEEWAGCEKKSVDLVVGCNPEVIDLEMGLPAYGPRKSALRMDIVALERANDLLQIVFWGAKTIDDSRLRARDFRPDESPKILKQIKDYRDFMSDPAREKSVTDGYRRACATLCRLHEMARAVVPIEDLAPVVREAAASHSSLSVDPTPRLVVFASDDPASRSWPEHEAKLRSAGVNLLIRNPNTCRFSEFEAGA